jgi:hypothetical protein
MKRSEAADVKALVRAIPDGVEIKDGQVDVDPARWELLGIVGATYKDTTAANYGVWVYDYVEGEEWRTGYCAWQVPLSWVTLTLWSWLVPLHYPCKVSGGEEGERKDRIIETMRKATKALGGDTLVVVGFGSLDVVNAQSGQTVASTDMVSGAGLALKSKGGAAPALEKAGDKAPGTSL